MLNLLIAFLAAMCYLALILMFAVALVAIVALASVVAVAASLVDLFVIALEKTGASNPRKRIGGKAWGGVAELIAAFSKYLPGSN